MKRVYRMAPSPTGHLHLGHAKSYLMNYALAKADGAIFLLRIEDTDQKRNKLETVDSMIEDCKWLGITYDGGPEIGKKNEYFQSERFPIYQKFAQKLLDEGKAYKAYETPEERQVQIAEQRKKGQAPAYMGNHANLTKEEQEAFEKEGRKPILRLRVPKNEVIKFKDQVYGEISINTNEIGDLAIQKSDGSPMYIFAVVVDDYLMEVTNIVRGKQHLSSIPKQLLIYRALGIEDKIPEFAHFSDLLNETAPGKLSKRHGAKPISKYRAEGYLPDAIFNYLIVTSCSFSFASKEEEIMNREEIYSKISPSKILKTNSKFNAAKLDWFNGQHMRKLSEEEFYNFVINWLEKDAKTLKQFDETFNDSLVDLFLNNKEILRKALPLVQTRINKLVDIIAALKFLFVEPNAKEIDVAPTKHADTEVHAMVKSLHKLFTDLKTPWTQETWEQGVRGIADEMEWKHADAFMALRLAIVGDRFSPPLFEAMVILGSEKCLRRINNYLEEK